MKKTNNGKNNCKGEIIQGEKRKKKWKEKLIVKEK